MSGLLTRKIITQLGVGEAALSDHLQGTLAQIEPQSEFAPTRGRAVRTRAINLAGEQKQLFRLIHKVLLLGSSTNIVCSTRG